MITNIIKSIYRKFKFIILSFKYYFLCERNVGFDIFFNDCQNSILFITHRLGGGTLQYEKNYAQEQKCNIFFLRIISYRKDLCYELENYYTGKKVYIETKKINEVFKRQYKIVVVNSLVQFYDLFKFIDILISYKEKNIRIPLVYHIHDFHCVCPVINLVADNWNCYLQCEKHNCEFNFYEQCYDGKISIYRNKWYDFLSLIDEIICFSEDSKNIILNAYKTLNSNKIAVKPHKMNYCNFTPLKNIEKLPIHIGIVGSVFTIPKGKLVVQELIRRLSDDIPISIIGATNRQIGMKREKLKCLGAYKHSELPTLLNQEKITVIVFPSICPETFSFLVSEHIQFDLPIICFNMGAQADKVKNYKKGIVVENIDEMIEVLLKMKKGDLL